MNPANVPLAERAQKMLLAAIAESDLPVGIRIRSGDLLLVETDGSGGLATSILNHAGGQAKRFDPLKIPLSTLTQLIEDGYRGSALQDRLGPNPVDSRMSDFQMLKSALQRADIGRHAGIIEAHERQQQNDSGLLGKIYREPAADGYAYYMVTQERPGQVRLNSLPVHDAYVSAQLGHDAWTEPERIRSSILAMEQSSGHKSTRRGP